MKGLLLLFISFFLKSDFQKQITITKKGWLVYRYGDNLAFFPIKNKAVTPTYENFFTEEKEDGQRMNPNHSAPPKLLIAKQLPIGVYDFDTLIRKEKYVGKEKFYIQPVKYVYVAESLASDTADYENGVMGWTFQIKGKPVPHKIFHYMLNRGGQIYYLNKQDSLFSEKGGRRKNIEIYPPH